MTQTLTEIQSLLASEGLSPQSRFGQNFLIDGNLLRKLAAAAELTASDTVLEVGPGTGVLTDAIAAQAGAVIAVEIDAGFCRLLEKRFAGRASLTLLHTDVLAGKHAVEPAVREAVDAARNRLGGRFLLVANLPYNIATPLVMDLLEWQAPPERCCITIQKEVAARFVATPADDAYGPVSVVVQSACSVHTIARVPPTAFWPRPKVDSSMLQLDLRSDRILSIPKLSRLVHGGFAHRRKTLRYNLREVLGDDALTQLSEDETAWLAQRPERITIAQWQRLAEIYRNLPGSAS